MVHIVILKKIGVTDQNFHLLIIILGYSQHYIVLKWESRLTFSLNAAKITNFILKNCSNKSC